MSIEDYKKKNCEKQKHIDGLNKLQKDAQLWEKKAYESAEDIIALEKDIREKKKDSLIDFIKKKSKQEELDIIDKDNKIILKDAPTEKLYFEFTFAEKENKFKIFEFGKEIKVIVFKYAYEDCPKLPDVESSFTSNEQDKSIKLKIEIAKKQIEQDKVKKEFIINNELLIKIEGINPKYNKLYTDDEFWEEIFKTQ